MNNEPFPVVKGTRIDFVSVMENGLEKKEREHFMKCPDCGHWFDMRDLAEVISHEHWMPQKPEISFSHVKMVGKENEVYIKFGNRLVTMRRKK